ncbi:MAG: hypothetical protein EB090_03000 [Verrucomicrobia bacterium]|nr:hypothetical protein [Verrucomicrobiota bacterium]
MRTSIYLSVILVLFGIRGMAQTGGDASPAGSPAPDQGVLLQKVSDAINPDADGDRTKLIRQGLAALADLNAAGTKPEQSVDQAKTKGNLSGGKTEKMSKMLLEMWNLNTERMSEPATLEALRAGRMPDPALKRP